jgi:hypothetical protein
MSKGVAQEVGVPTQEELKTLKAEWEAGKLAGISAHLLEFVERHRDEILAAANFSYRR